MVEWVGVLIAGVAALFDRIEHREDKLQQRTDFLEPLLELYHLVSEWERFAEVTNSHLAAWLNADTQEESSTAASKVFYATAPQFVSAHDIEALTGIESDPDAAVEHREKLELRDLIAIYAPDLQDQFLVVMRLRVRQLQYVRELAKRQDPPREPAEQSLYMNAFETWTGLPTWRPVEVNEQMVRDLERSREQLSELRREIASFIGTHWDAKDVIL